MFQEVYSQCQYSRDPVGSEQRFLPKRTLCQRGRPAAEASPGPQAAGENPPAGHWSVTASGQTLLGTTVPTHYHGLQMAA